MNVRPQDKKKIVDLISIIIPNAKIYLYGSRARGDHNRGSDVDIAVDRGGTIPSECIGEARSILEASNIIYRVDLVDYHSISEKFRTIIDQDKILWKS